MKEPRVCVYSGRVTSILHAPDLSPSTTLGNPPRFAGYDSAGVPIPTPRLPEYYGCKSSGQRVAANNTSRAIGVAWVDEHGNEQVSRAPLTVVCDGRYSMLRTNVTASEPRTLSFMVGLLLVHPPGRHGILPYSRRGHVILATPGIILLYQISSFESRVLVDVPAPLPNVADGSLQK